MQVGTFGYVAPEYADTGHLNMASDVYRWAMMIILMRIW